MVAKPNSLLCQNYPALNRVITAQLAVWPDHESYLSSRFLGDHPDFVERTEVVADLVLKLTGDDIEQYCADYMWMCKNFNEEQMYFCRSRKYRYTTFAEAYENVYGNDKYMARYVRGILLSQVFWSNHAKAIDYFRNKFLGNAPKGFDYLEIGPGHGLFLYFAASHPLAGTVSAWELSDASVAATRACLAHFGVSEKVTLVQNDVLKANSSGDNFDMILISEVLEHLERPELALDTLRRSLKPNSGRLLVNIPINSPAPDHIYLWESIDDVKCFLKGCNLWIVDEEYFPPTGYTLEQAMKHRLAVSCVISCGCL